MEQRRIVLLGKTGDGKSSAGNTILGENIFTAKASANSATAKCKRVDGMVYGRKITIIDTPGVFDTDLGDSEMKSEISKSLIECAPGIDAFVIVLKVGRYTSQEMEVVQQLLNTFEENVLKHVVILFTFGEQLEDQTLEEFMKGNSQLQQLIQKFEGRCHVIDNKFWNDCHSGYKSNSVQMKNMLDTIDKIVQENGCYTNELLKSLEKAIQDEMKNITENHLPLEAKQEKAKKSVHKKILIAGATTGALVGAFLGVGVAVASVLALLQMFPTLKKLVKSRVEGFSAESGVKAVTEGAVTVATGGTAAAVETGMATGGTGAGITTRIGIAAGVLGTAALSGAVGGAVTGWKTSEEANSVYDAMKIAAIVNYENAKAVVEKVQEFAALSLNNKT